MSAKAPAKVAIVDYGLGNLFSVKHACTHVGMQATITFSRQEILDADGVILPGVGAFADAMESLRGLDLIAPLKEVAASGTPFLGICLGLQLMMTESYEFGTHRGLALIEGPVVRFEDSVERFGSPTDGDLRKLKVPQVGWNRIYRRKYGAARVSPDLWLGTPLEGLRDGEFMYFVHSYYAQPREAGVGLSVSLYGSIEFCSSLRHCNLFGCQFHPERSGPQGLQIYRNLASLIAARNASKEGSNA